jgi:CBS domain-containing protein
MNQTSFLGLLYLALELPTLRLRKLLELRTPRPHGQLSDVAGGGGMLIKDVLHGKGHEVVAIADTDRISVALGKLAQHNIGALVVENQWMKLVGVFSERDFVNAVARDGEVVLTYEVRQLMSTYIISCRLSDRIDSALATMTLAKVRHLPVIEDGELKGIVSIGDLVKHRLEEKELEASVLLELSRLHH